MRLIVKNWSEFQHYTKRRPPWIKLHKHLLDDYEYLTLPLASKALAPLLWLIASESDDGSIPADRKKLAFRLRCTEKEIDSAINPMIDRGFLICEHDASDALADCEQVAPLETEERQRQRERQSARPSKRCPSDFLPSPDLWAEMRAECPGIDMTRETKKFMDHTFKDSRSDWPATWRNWIRGAYDRLPNGANRGKAKPADILGQSVAHAFEPLHSPALQD